MPAAAMNIGQAAAASGVSAKMIRYYESAGLVAAAPRSASGYRVYGERHIHTLRFIRRARDLGFSVAQISQLLDLWNDQRRASADVKRIALSHVAQLEQKALELSQMADLLRQLARECCGDKRPDCPIIENLAGETTHPQATSAQTTTRQKTAAAKATASPRKITLSAARSKTAKPQPPRTHAA